MAITVSQPGSPDAIEEHPPSSTHEAGHEADPR